MSRFTTTIVLGLQLCLFGAMSAGCGSDKSREPHGTAGSSGSGGASQGPPTGNAGTNAGGTNGGGATGGTIGQPPPGSARVQFVLKEVH